MGRSAPPASLFALGIVITAAVRWPLGAATWSIVAIKVVLYPLLAFGAFATLEIEASAANILMLVAAGPCGAMTFVIALQYGVHAENARAIILYY